MKYAVCIMVVAVSVLGGCARPKPAPLVTDASPMSKAISAELEKASLSQFDRCFPVLERSELNTSYLVFKDDKGRRACVVTVARSPASVLSKLGPAILAANVADPDQCSMKTLSCINPAAARQISVKYGSKPTLK